MRDEAFTIQTLATHAQVPVSTVRYYREKGLIRPPYGPRCAPIYTNDHLRDLMRIVEIRRNTLRLDDLEPPAPHIIKVKHG